MEMYGLHVDYFGLSKVAWKRELLKLDNLMTPVSMGDTSSGDSVNINLDYDEFHSFNPLEMIRSDAYEEFRSNGVDTDLDELDVYQFKLRESSTVSTGKAASSRQLTCPVPRSTSTNPALSSYLALKDHRKNLRKAKGCVFCKNNGEAVSFYSNHNVKEYDGKVSCPVLRQYVCPICGVSGDNAHTVRYCPMNEKVDVLYPRSSRQSTGQYKPIPM